MRRTRLRLTLAGLTIVTVAALWSLAPAFAAPAGPTGFSTAGASGFTITNISYELDATTIDRVAGVSFRLQPADATTARVRLGAAVGDCTIVDGLASCSFAAEPRVADVSSLEIVAAS